MVSISKKAVLVISLLLLATPHCLAAFMDFEIGESRIYDMNEGQDSWTLTLDTIGTRELSSNTYYELTQTGYEPGAVRTLLIRSTDNEIYQYKDGTEFLAFKTGEVGDSWEWTDGDGVRHKREIIGVDQSVTVPYGTYLSYIYESYRDDLYGGVQPYQNHYFTDTDGIGFLYESDWYSGDPSNPHIQALADIKPVPIPGALMLLFSGLCGIAGWSRRRKR